MVNGFSLANYTKFYKTQGVTAGRCLQSIHTCRALAGSLRTSASHDFSASSVAGHDQLAETHVSCGGDVPPSWAYQRSKSALQPPDEKWVNPMNPKMRSGQNSV
ncbi:hypothetical protein KIL84_005615 [Mauremys mutica]|uniref:Uncharacterized protein n=1 Tax=Mauremys mutica TaxID=74926 RepID=A0A9D4B446_9SAUR|nr:hypothetical protein KIL84_005615 [Mauremys mutica]